MASFAGRRSASLMYSSRCSGVKAPLYFCMFSRTHSLALLYSSRPFLKSGRTYRFMPSVLQVSGLVRTWWKWLSLVTKSPSLRNQTTGRELTMCRRHMDFAVLPTGEMSETRMFRSGSIPFTHSSARDKMDSNWIDFTSLFRSPNLISLMSFALFSRLQRSDLDLLKYFIISGIAAMNVSCLKRYEPSRIFIAPKRLNSALLRLLQSARQPVGLPLSFTTVLFSKRLMATSTTVPEA